MSRAFPTLSVGSGPLGAHFGRRLVCWYLSSEDAPCFMKVPKRKVQSTVRNAGPNRDLVLKVLSALPAATIERGGEDTRVQLPVSYSEGGGYLGRAGSSLSSPCISRED